MVGTNGNPSIYTPDELLWRFNDAVWTRGTTGCIRVKGVYVRQDFPLSDGKYIDKIVSELNNVGLNIILTESFRKVIQDGNVIVVTGYLDRFVDNKDGCIRLQIRVTNLDAMEQSSILSAKEIELSGVRHQKMLRGYRAVHSLLAEKIGVARPRVALLYPTSSIVHDDFNRELGEAASRYSFQEIRTSFSNERMLVAELLAADAGGYDAVCLVRGGGSDFGALSSLSVLKAVAEMMTPVMAAIGHENDKLFINEVVDRSFSTPTSLGGFLRSVVEDHDRRERQVYQMGENLREKEYLVSDLKGKLRKAVWALVIVTVLLVLAVMYFVKGAGLVSLLGTS
jgi:hypothetical protein